MEDNPHLSVFKYCLPAYSVLETYAIDSVPGEISFFLGSDRKIFLKLFSIVIEDRLIGGPYELILIIIVPKIFFYVPV